MPLKAAPRSPGLFEGTIDLVTVTGGGSHSFVEAEGGRLVFESDGDITLTAATGHDTFIQGVSVYELEQTVQVQADRIILMEGEMEEVRRQLAELQLATYSIQHERKVEKAAEELAPPGLAGMLARTLTGRRGTNG